MILAKVGGAVLTTASFIFKLLDLALDTAGVCEFCWKETEKKTYAEIANEYELRSEQAVGENRRKAAGTICREMAALGYEFFIIPKK